MYKLLRDSRAAFSFVPQFFSCSTARLVSLRHPFTPTQKNEFVEEQRQADTPNPTYYLHHLVIDECCSTRAKRRTLKCAMQSFSTWQFCCSDIFRDQTTAQVLTPLLALPCYCSTGFMQVCNPQILVRALGAFTRCAEVHVPNMAAIVTCAGHSEASQPHRKRLNYSNLARHA